MKRILALILLCTPVVLPAQEWTPPQDGDLFDMSLEDLLNLEVVDRNFYLYGYINSNFEKTFNRPSRSIDGATLRTSTPGEWTPVKNFHLYGQGNFTSRISYLFNLAANDGVLEVRNAWGNYAFRDAFQIRAGRMYRKFGLYNERLDQIPTFIGIEPPEMFDGDHLFLSRTTNLMVHGRFMNSYREISYALMTDNGEGGAQRKTVPLGWDLRYKSLTRSFLFGASGYFSNIGQTPSVPSVGFGQGAPDGGILPWMAGDRYAITGVYFEKQLGKILLQSEYYLARHKAVRDADQVLLLLSEAEVNEYQRQRFLTAGAESSAPVTVDDVRTDATFDVQTWYIRLGYNIQTDAGQFVPYLFLDWMSHPEMIRDKSFGGDDEAGLADDGKFLKPSIGLLYRPIPNVAIKLDGSYHVQKYNGVNVAYPELRLDFSFAFSNSQLAQSLGN